jgi:hypothetical protein
MNDKLDSFNKNKRKCKECKKYFDLDTTSFKFSDTCFECGIKHITKMFIYFQKHPDIALPAPLLEKLYQELVENKSNDDIALPTPMLEKLYQEFNLNSTENKSNE